MPPKRKIANDQPLSQSQNVVDNNNASAPVNPGAMLMNADEILSAYKLPPLGVPQVKKAAIAEVADKKKTENVEKIGFQYPQLYKQVSKKYAQDPNALIEKQKLLQKVIDEENWYRELFAQNRESPHIQDPHLILVDAHADQDIFKYNIPTKAEANIPTVFPLSASQLEKAKQGGSSIVDHKEFLRNFDVFTEGQFRFMNWDNVFVAGGSVLAALLPLPGEHGKNNQARRNYYHKLAYKNSDIDIFLYGLSEEKANEKLKEIYFSIQEALPCPAICFRSKHAVSIVSQFPYRHIQIVLRLYKSPAEILMGFDVDVCGLGFDGHKVWMTPRAHYALTHQCNTIDMERRSPSYEMRLAKYSQRGFAVQVPTLDRSRIDPQLFERRFDQLQGLAKLVLLEKLSSPEARTRYKEHLRLLKMRPAPGQRSSLLDHLSGMSKDEYVKERLEDGGGDASDYSTVFLPWGPKWSADKVRKLMYTKDMVLNSQWYDPSKKYHTHPCFFGTAEEILKDCCGHCPPIPEKDVDPDSPYVAGKLAWITVNPGQQAKIGSFHPITEGDWTEGAYFNPSTESLCQAVNANDVATVHKLISQGADVNARDSLGRTPLMISAFSNSVEAASLLLHAGAKIAIRVSDGRNALHIACGYGHDKIAKLILERSELVKKQKEAEKAQAAKADNKKAKKPAKAKPAKKGGKKKKDEDEEDEEMDEEEEEEEEEEDFDSIKSRIQARKDQEKKMLEEEDPSLKVEDEEIIDINAKDWDFKFAAVDWAIAFGHVGATKVLIEKGAAYLEPLEVHTLTRLQLALLNGNLDVIQLLIEKGCSLTQVDGNYSTALHTAVAARNLEAVKFFLDKTDKKTKSEIINAFNKHWETPMMLAIVSHRDTGEDDENSDKMDTDSAEFDTLDEVSLDIMKILVKHGAKAHLDEKDLPPANVLQQKGMHLSGGSSRSQLRNAVTQPLTQAANLGSLKAMEFLIDSGADVNWVTNHNTTVLDIIDANIPAEVKKNNQNNNNLSWQQQQYNHLKGQIKKAKANSWLHYELEWYKEYILKPQVKSGKKHKRHFKFQQQQQQQQEETKTKEQKEKEKKFQEARAKYFQEIHDYLTRKALGAKKFKDLKLTNKDDQKELGPHQKQNNNYGIGYQLDFMMSAVLTMFGSQQAIADFEIQYVSVVDQIPGVYTRNQTFTDTKASYDELYEAVYKGDLKKIEQVTIKQPIGKQVHIASKSSLSDRTPVQIALSLSKYDLAFRLLEIALEQFTPLEVKVKANEEEKPRVINNYELATLMGQFRPGQFLDNAGFLNVGLKVQVDPNAPVQQLNCITSLAGILKNQDSRQNAALHQLVQDGDSATFERILQFLINKKVASNPYDPQPKKDLGAVHPNQRDNEAAPRDLYLALLLTTGPGGLTPLELAVASGNVPAIEICLKFGGMQAEVKEPEDVYEGLDVGGKKADWALEHRAPKKYIPARTLVQLATFHDQDKALDFLVNKGLAVWDKEGKKHQPQSLPQDSHFAIDHLDAQGQSAVFYALANSSKKTLEALIAMSQKMQQPLVGVADKNGITPVIICASKGQLEPLEILLNAGAQIDAVDTTRGWTALHFAAERDHDVIVKALLQRSTKQQANMRSKTFGHTPLVVASYYGSLKSLKLMLASEKIDVSLKDSCGEFAAHHAVKQNRTSCVQLLLPKSDANFIDESGVGLTLYDCSLLNLVKRFHATPGENRHHSIVPSFTGAWKQKEIYDHFQTIGTRKRKLATQSDVRGVSETILHNVEEVTKKHQEELMKAARHYHNDESVVGMPTGTINTYVNMQNMDEPEYDESDDD